MSATALAAGVVPADSVFALEQYRADRYQGLSELQEVRIVGCSLTSTEQLIGVIQSRESELSITRRLGRYVQENVARNPATPTPILKTLERLQENLKSELRYFSPSKASDDSVALLEYLNQHGFHDARVTWDFGYDPSVKRNVLKFNINEGVQAVVDTVLIYGLDSIPADIYQRVVSELKIDKGDPYSESLLTSSLAAMSRMLQNNGYYKASFTQPIVKSSSDLSRDTIAVVFTTGKRKRIGSILFQENNNSFPGITQTMRSRQIEFATGEWYNRDLIEASRNNLISLGVFEIVTIDTIVPNHSDLSPQSLSDSVISLRVFTMNNKPSDLGFNVLFFQTAVDNYLNAGVGATYQHRNLFGGAQVGSLTAQYILQDISGFLQGQPLQREAVISGVLAWPSLFRIWNWRGGLQSNIYYSERVLVSPFRLSSFGVLTRMPVSLPLFLGVNGIDASIGLERQVPREFQGALDSALVDAETPEEIAFVYSTLNQFLVLDKYLHTGNTPWFTSIYLGANIRGEHRDNVMDPRSGYTANVSIEAGIGAGQFVRSQAFYSSIFPVSVQSTIATKIKAGHIFLLGFSRGSTTDTNTYVSIERQYFAGGAASIRSFPSRQLHDPHSGELEALDETQNLLLSNTVGSASLLELSAEYRYRFPKPAGWDSFWASLVERSGLTVFTDIGNAFNRLTTGKYGTMRLRDLWEGSVIAMGIGYRFDTPVGPFRFDYATSIYDPLRKDGKWIFSGREHPFSLSNWHISIGLGHPF